MMVTDPRAFDAALRQVLSEQQHQILARWSGPRAAYTSLMKTELLPKVGHLLGLQHHPYEYYSLDCIYVEGYDTEHFGPNSGYPLYFAVIVEHENDPKRSCEEMSKLLLFNAPLKVLITYRSGSQLDTDLSRYAKIIEASGSALTASTSQRVLVVFGDKPQELPTWRSYLYEDGTFCEITPTGA